MESDNSNIRKSRNQKLKESNPEEYKRRQDLKNENARKRYAEKKLNDPEEWRRQQDLKNKMSRMRRNEKHFSSGDYKTPENSERDLINF